VVFVFILVAAETHVDREDANKHVFFKFKHALIYLLKM